MIRELKEELERLKKGGAAGGGGGGELSEEMKAEMEEQRRLLEQFQREKDEYAEKLKAQQEEHERKKKESELMNILPHLKNINSDPSMSGMIKKAMKDGSNFMGKENKDFTPDIPINGVGITNKHCLIKYDSGSRSATVYPNAEDPEKYSIKVNGTPVIAEPIPLNHGDRLLVGNHHYWIYCDPEINKDEMVNWEVAMKEANADSLKILDGDNEDLAKYKE